MWKWILLILTPFVVLAIFEEVINYIVLRMTGTKRKRKKSKKKDLQIPESKQHSHGS